MDQICACVLLSDIDKFIFTPLSMHFHNENLFRNMYFLDICYMEDMSVEKLK